MKLQIIPAISKALFDTDLIATRLTLALAELIWAILLAWPGNTFDRPTYHIMAGMLPEDYWAFIFLVSAVVQFHIVIQYQFESMFAHLFALWNASIWTLVVASMFISVYPLPAAIAGEIALAASAVWVCVRPYIVMEGVRRVRYSAK